MKSTKYVLQPYGDYVTIK